MSIIERQDILDAARKYVGSKFILNGRNPQQGVDCGGILILVAKDCNKHWSEFPRRYASCPVRANERGCFLQTHMKEVPLEELQPGMVLALRVLKAPVVHHMAIYAGPGADGDGRMIHAHEDAGKVVESRVGKYWRSRIVSVFDWMTEWEWELARSLADAPT